MPRRYPATVRKTVIMMSKRSDRNTRNTRTTRTPVAVADVPVADTTIVPVPEPVADVVAVAEPEPVAVADAIDARIAESFPDASPASAAYVSNMAHAFAAVAAMPTATIDDRAAVRDAIVARMTAAYPGAIAASATIGRNTGRFSGLHVFESQNTAYVAAAMSGVFINVGHFVAAWAADVPTARCAYMTTAYDKRYPTSTLTDYVNGRHNGVPGIPGARAAVMAWINAGCNKPTAPTA